MKEIAKIADEISSADTYTINKTLKLNTVNEGESIDNVLVHGADNEVKSVPRSNFTAIETPNLQKVFDVGRVINSDLSLGIYKLSTEDNLSIDGSIISFYDNISKGLEINKEKIFAYTATANGTKSNTLSFDNNVYSQNTYRFPDKPNGTYTLATTDDIPVYTPPPTINDVLSNGSVAVDKSMVMFNQDFSNYLQLASASLVLGNGSNTVYLSAGSLLFSKDTTTTYYQNNKIRVSENGTQDKDFVFPDKPKGTYTLATTEYFKTINGNSIVGEGDIVLSGGSTSGTYTPTMTNGTNIKDIMIEEAFWTKTGNVVTVTCSLNFNFTEVSKSSSLRISLPFKNTSAATNLGIGNLISPFSDPMAGVVQRDSQNTALFVVKSSTDPNYHAGVVTFTYTTN